MGNSVTTSICIPVFNGAATLAETLESAFAQEPRADEILLVDNASTDNTLAIAESFAPRGLRIQVNERNLGFNGNFNQCLKLAKGRYVLILSADDLLYRDAVGVLSQALDANPNAAFAFSAADLIDEQGRQTGCQRAVLEEGLIPGRRYLEHILLDSYPTVLNTTMFHRERLLGVGGFNSRFVNSDFVVAALLSSRNDVAYHNRALGAYRVVADSTGEQMLYGRADMLSQKMTMLEVLFAALGDDYRQLRTPSEIRWIRFAEGMLIPLRLRYGWMRAGLLALDILRWRSRRLVHPRFLAAAGVALLLPRAWSRQLFKFVAAVLGKRGAAIQRSLS